MKENKSWKDYIEHIEIEDEERIFRITSYK